MADHDHAPDPTNASTGGSSVATATQADAANERPVNRRFETNWAISLFGTAVGAGSLLLAR